MVGSARSFRTAFVVPSLVAVAVLAGCVSNDTPLDVNVGPGPFVDPMAFVEGHSHGDYAQHQLAWNMTELGWSELVPDLSVAWGELDVKGDMAVVAFAWPTAGFATVDVSDPAAPRLLDFIDVGYGYGADVKWMDSGPWAVLGIQTTRQEFDNVAVDPPASVVEGSIRLFHITDEGEIHDVDAWAPAPTAGVHMVYTHVINGKEYVFAAFNSAGISVYRIDPGPAGGVMPILVHVSGTFDPAFLNPSGFGSFLPGGAHDITVIDDPLLGKPLLYVADGYLGLYVYDISDPESPAWRTSLLGSWRDPDNTWYMHTAQAYVTDDGRRLVILAPEVFSDAEAEVVAPLWLLDATDLADMKLLATWKNPGDHGAEQLRYSVHNFQFVDGKIALAHYHGGVWLLDVNVAADNATITAAGYILPSHDPGRAMSGIYHGIYNMGDAPTVWDVVVHNGVIWATDVNSGLYAIGTPAWTPGDVAVKSLG